MGIELQTYSPTGRGKRPIAMGTPTGCSSSPGGLTVSMQLDDGQSTRLRMSVADAVKLRRYLEIASTACWESNLPHGRTAHLLDDEYGRDMERRR